MPPVVPDPPPSDLVGNVCPDAAPIRDVPRRGNGHDQRAARSWWRGRVALTGSLNQRVMIRWPEPRRRIRPATLLSLDERDHEEVSRVRARRLRPGAPPTRRVPRAARCGARSLAGRLSPTHELSPSRRPGGPAFRTRRHRAWAVGIRSSGAAEGGREVSYAGQFDTGLKTTDPRPGRGDPAVPPISHVGPRPGSYAGLGTRAMAILIQPHDRGPMLAGIAIQRRPRQRGPPRRHRGCGGSR